MSGCPSLRPGINYAAGPRARQLRARLHQGEYTEMLRRHEDESLRARHDPALRAALLADLGKRIAHERNIKCAIDALTVGPPKAPGPNGLRLEQLTDREQWSLARAVGELVANPGYHPARPRVTHVPKASGDKTRPITLANEEDRVIQRAILQVVQPLLDSLFDDRSFGFRPGRGREHALALAELLIEQGERRVVIVEDLEEAFCHVPAERLLQVVASHGMPGEVVEMIRRANIRGRRGIPQGGPLSPLLLNLYLDHFLDQLWRHQCPDIPLIRVADDLLLLCRNAPEAQEAYTRLERLLLPTGMTLKGSRNTSIRTLDPSQPVSWLGYAITLHDRRLEARVGEKAYRALELALQECHELPAPPLAANVTVSGWLSQMGAAYVEGESRQALERLRQVAHTAGFEEIGPLGEWERTWREAHVRYCSVRRVVRLMMAEPDGLGGSAYPPRTAHCGRGEGGSTVAPPSPLFTRDEVIIFTDGSCIRSGGDQIGGWAYSIRDRGEIRFGQGSASRTTNNRMELTAVIEALRAVGEPGRFVTVWSDSRYVVDGIAQLGQWHARGWKRRRGGLMANWDLWRELFAVHQQHGTEFRWVPAHAGNRLNEEVHALAFEAAQAADSRQL